MDIESACLWV